MARSLRQTKPLWIDNREPVFLGATGHANTISQVLCVAAHPMKGNDQRRVFVRILWDIQIVLPFNPVVFKGAGRRDLCGNAL